MERLAKLDKNKADKDKIIKVIEMISQFSDLVVIGSVVGFFVF